MLNKGLQLILIRELQFQACSYTCVLNNTVQPVPGAVGSLSTDKEVWLTQNKNQAQRLQHNVIQQDNTLWDWAIQ